MFFCYFRSVHGILVFCINVIFYYFFTRVALIVFSDQDYTFGYSAYIINHIFTIKEIKKITPFPLLCKLDNWHMGRNRALCRIGPHNPLGSCYSDLDHAG